MAALAEAHAARLRALRVEALRLDIERSVAVGGGQNHQHALPRRDALAGEFQGLPEDTTEENIQARIRGVLLMALSNKFGSIVLTTGNKSEMATGYCTLYGDMAGGFAVIKDVLKTTVFRLAHWRNVHDPYGTGINPIPERIITRPPSAELRPDQTDQDSLPPYEQLDSILEMLVEKEKTVREIVSAGQPEDVVRRIRA